MIITDRFVMLNFPKTGSSFARTVIKRLYNEFFDDSEDTHKRLFHKLGLCHKPFLKELILPTMFQRYHYGMSGQHGVFIQIPRVYRRKPVVSIIRNPFERYVSLYHYGWWQRVPPGDVKEISSAFPSYPDLSFGEYYNFLNTFERRNRLDGTETKADLGVHTIQFIQFYSWNPKQLLRRIDQDFIVSGKYRNYLADVLFFHQENLRHELYNYLLQLGFSSESLSFINRIERINVSLGKPAYDDITDYYNNEIVEDILKKDKLIFDLFPQYAIFPGTN